MLKSDSEQRKKYDEKLTLLRKRRMFYEDSIRQAQQEEAQKSAEIKKQELADRRERHKDTDHYKALRKIVKHLQNPKKFSKCLVMV